MVIDRSRLWRQVALGEDTDLELKEARFRGSKVSAPRRDPLADELAAFANADGGTLVLGVTDDREPQALEPAQLDALANLVGEICTDSIKPALNYRIFRAPVPEPASGGALVVEIPAGVTVHRSPGGYFHRRGDTRREMEAAEIRRLSLARGVSDAGSTDTQIVRGTAVNSLQPALWRRYASSRADEAPEALRTSQFTRNELLASRLGQCAVGDVPGAGGRQYFIERRGEGVAVIRDETFALAGQRRTCWSER